MPSTPDSFSPPSVALFVIFLFVVLMIAFLFFRKKWEAVTAYAIFCPPYEAPLDHGQLPLQHKVTSDESVNQSDSSIYASIVDRESIVQTFVQTQTTTNTKITISFDPPTKQHVSVLTCWDACLAEVYCLYFCRKNEEEVKDVQKKGTIDRPLSIRRTGLYVVIEREEMREDSCSLCLCQLCENEYSKSTTNTCSKRDGCLGRRSVGHRERSEMSATLQITLHVRLRL